MTSVSRVLSKSGRHRFDVPIQNEGLTAPFTPLFRSSFQGSVYTETLPIFGSTPPTLVARPLPLRGRSYFSASTTVRDFNIRCVVGGLGSAFRPIASSGDMGHRVVSSSYQRSRVGGSQESPGTFPPRCAGEICMGKDGQHHGSGVYKPSGGGTRSRQLWTLTKQMLLWCLSEGISLHAVHLPGKLNTIADLLSRLHDAPTEWTLSPGVNRPRVAEIRGPRGRSICGSQQPSTSTPGPLVWKVDAFSTHWGPLAGYAFPPFAIIPRVLAKVEHDQCQLLLVAPNWPGQTWFLRLLSLLAGVPFRFPDDPNLVVLPVSRQPHPSPRGLHLTVWPLSGKSGERRAFRRTLPKWLLKADIPPPSACILQDSDCSENGVRIARLLRIRPL